MGEPRNAAYDITYHAARRDCTRCDHLSMAAINRQGSVELHSRMDAVVCIPDHELEAVMHILRLAIESRR